MADTDDEAREEILMPRTAAPLGGGLAPTPYNFQFTGEDRLRLSVTTSVAVGLVAVHYRMQRPGAPTHATRYTFAPTTAYTTETVEFTIGEGYLLNLSVVAEGIPSNVAQVFARVQVIRGSGAAAILLGTIVQGYVTGSSDLAWPGSPIVDSLAGAGKVRFFTSTIPIPPNTPTVNVPNGARWELLAWSTLLTSSAVAGARRPRLALRFGGTAIAAASQPQTTGPATVARHMWAVGLPFEVALTVATTVTGLPTPFFLGASCSIDMTVDAGDPGDTWSEATYVIREWLEVS